MVKRRRGDRYGQIDRRRRGGKTVARLRGLDHDRAGARDREHVAVERRRARDNAQADWQVQRRLGVQADRDVAVGLRGNRANVMVWMAGVTVSVTAGEVLES